MWLEPLLLTKGKGRAPVRGQSVQPGAHGTTGTDVQDEAASARIDARLRNRYFKER